MSECPVQSVAVTGKGGKSDGYRMLWALEHCTEGGESVIGPPDDRGAESA